MDMMASGDGSNAGMALPGDNPLKKSCPSFDSIMIVASRSKRIETHCHSHRKQMSSRNLPSRV